jgi:phosphate-selective porin
MEKSIAVNAAQDRAEGGQITYFGKTWQIYGISGEAVGNENRTDNSRYSLNARSTIVPINNAHQVLHIGLATARIIDKKGKGAWELALRTSRNNRFLGSAVNGVNNIIKKQHRINFGV